MKENQKSSPEEIMFAPAKVLIVDDNDLNRMMMKAYLEPFNLELYFAVSGKGAIEQAQKYHPDLILMDLKMPEMDGHEASQQLKTKESCKNIPIIAITGMAFAQDKESLKQYCEGFLPKPFDRLGLLTEMKKFLK